MNLIRKIQKYKMTLSKAGRNSSIDHSFTTKVDLYEIQEP